MRGLNNAIEAKEHLELIFNMNPDATLITNLYTGLVVDVNQGFIDLTGYVKEEIIGKSTVEIDFYDNPLDRQRILSELISKGYCNNIEMVFNKKSGEKMTALVSSKLITIKDEPYIISVIRDITERREYEEKLKRSEERYRVLAENISDVIWVLDPETMRFVYVSPSVYNLRGYTPEEVMAEPMDAALTEEGAKHVRRIIEERIKDFLSGDENAYKCYTEEVEQPRKDGTLVWTEVITRFFINKETKKVEIRGVSRDISARKQAEEKLKKSEEKYRTLFQNAIEMIMVIQNEELKIFNPMVTSLTGYLEEELASRNFLQFIHKEDRELVLSNYESKIKGDSQENRCIYRIIKKDDSVMWVESNSVTILWEGKTAVLVFLTDITERKKREEEILYLSYIDQLTGVYNRRFYEETLKVLDCQDNLPLTVVMADVNGLKLTNDAFGHVMGDRLLKIVAESMKKCCRAGDIIARIGGDEFVILFPKTEGEEALKIVDNIKVYLKNKEINNIIISASFGWATKRDVKEEITMISMEAEDRMYRKKLIESIDMKKQTINNICQTLHGEYEKEKQHAERVSKLVESLGIKLGLSKLDLDELKIAGLMHDIGKIGIDKTIIDKNNRLNDLEFLEIRKHSEIGYHILRSVSEFSEIAEIVLAHHENIDGSGYPKGIKGDEIHYKAKIIAVADAYDNMTRHNFSEKPLTKDEAIEELRKNMGVKFDSNIVEVFIEEVLEYID